MIKQVFGDFRDTMHQASEYLKNLQRDGWNVNLFESVVDLLPDPNGPWDEWSDVLDDVQHSLCEQHNGKFDYALIPIVAGAVGTKFAATSNEFETICFTGTTTTHIAPG
jgi:hypothetical protein